MDAIYNEMGLKINLKNLGTFYKKKLLISSFLLRVGSQLGLKFELFLSFCHLFFFEKASVLCYYVLICIAFIIVVLYTCKWCIIVQM